MSTNVSLEYANAYSEVLEVLKNMSKEDIKKIPKEILEMFEENCNNENEFKYDLTKKFEEQNISKRAKIILSILFRDYWATEIQKEKIIKTQEYRRKELEIEKENKYNVKAPFNKQSLEEKNKNIEELNIITPYKESIWIKIINKVKAVFHIK